MNYLAIIIVVISVLSVFIGKEWRWTGPTISKTIQRNFSAGALHSIVSFFFFGIDCYQLIFFESFLRVRYIDLLDH